MEYIPDSIWILLFLIALDSIFFLPPIVLETLSRFPTVKRVTESIFIEMAFWLFGFVMVASVCYLPMGLMAHFQDAEVLKISASTFLFTLIGVCGVIAFASLWVILLYYRITHRGRWPEYKNECFQ
ncbi:MAG: hypothetical protein KY468_06155 [Armatimonadetes bacterium]|nr:hypothetical protein [Armatimonadota bacterium]